MIFVEQCVHCRTQAASHHGKSMASLFRSITKMMRKWKNLQKISTFQQRRWLQNFNQALMAVKHKNTFKTGRVPHLPSSYQHSATWSAHILQHPCSNLTAFRFWPWRRYLHQLSKRWWVFKVFWCFTISRTWLKFCLSKSCRLRSRKTLTAVSKNKDKIISHFFLSEYSRKYNTVHGNPDQITLLTFVRLWHWTKKSF